MATIPDPTEMTDEVRAALVSKAYLFDHPDDYLAGVEDAVRALAGPRSRILLLQEGGREEWLRTLEQYRTACGPPVSRSARAFEARLERQLSA